MYFLAFHDSKESSETAVSKKEVQDFAAQYGIQIKSIRADNSAYATNLFKNSCDADHHEPSFCAV